MKRVAILAIMIILAITAIGCSQGNSTEAEEWTVTFIDDGAVIEKVEVAKSSTGVPVPCPNDVKKDGFVIADWRTNVSDDMAKVKKSTKNEGGYYVVVYTDNVEVYPIFAEGYTVTFTDGLGKVLKRSTVEAGGSIPTIDEPIREGYEFAGWDQDPKSVTEDATLNATWIERPKWTVTFTDGLGNILKNETVYNGGIATAPAHPIREGYDFDRWDKPFHSITSDLTVNATWKIKPTMGMTNALKTAQSYLRSSSFSHDRLVEQLEYEKYAHDEAVYGADNCGADWNEQAAKAARSYLNFTSFSRGGLIDQLIYEGFTYDQAVYGVDSVGL